MKTWKGSALARKPLRPILPASEASRCADDLIPLQRVLLGAAQKDDAAWEKYLRLTEAMAEMDRP
jgi:hypothetical protein